MRRYVICLDDATGEMFETFAKAERRSVANMAVVAFEEYMRRKEGDRKRQARREKGSDDAEHV